MSVDELAIQSIYPWYFVCLCVFVCFLLSSQIMPFNHWNLLSKRRNWITFDRHNKIGIGTFFLFRYSIDFRFTFLLLLSSTLSSYHYCVTSITVRYEHYSTSAVAFSYSLTYLCSIFHHMPQRNSFNTKSQAITLTSILIIPVVRR